jgi:PhoH-like ATPase
VVQAKKSVWGIRPRNKEQSFLLDSLLDPNIEVVTVIGKAGSGKTICAIAAGLAQTIDDNDPQYSRIIVSRPVQPLGKDIGFLPGTMEEKMSPWLMPIQDNLQFLMGNDKTTLDIYTQKGIIEIEALTYIRGRSISNAFIIIDEAQNLTTHELKTIITRVGEGTKIVLTGDVEQIDNVYINATSNGLTHAVEKFKLFELAAHVTLLKGERSKVATFAAKNL